MVDNSSAIVPVWTLETGDVRVTDVTLDGPMTAERLIELRSVLAALADQPIATLEVRPLPDRLDRSHGIPLDAASPLAHHLSQLIAQSAQGASVATEGGEALYRMVVPAKFAGQLAQGVVRPMRSKAVADGIRGPIMGAAGVVGQASFVPVSGVGTAAVAGGAVGTAGAAAAGGAAMTIAAPLVLMAVAVGVTAAAEHQRNLSIADCRGSSRIGWMAC